MNSSKIRFALFAGALVLLLTSGCAFTKDTYADAPLTPVKFESPEACQTFYNAILAKHFPVKEDEKKEGTSYGAELAMPISIDVQTTKSYRAIVNKAIAAADTNKDGIITQAEADAYAAAMTKEKSEKEDDDK